MKKTKYEKLMEPIRIGSMQVKNRIIFPPMNTNLTSEDGYVTPELEAYYLRRAKGGAGMIVLEASSVTGDSRNHPRQPMLHDRKYIASWAKMVEKIHRFGVKTSIELVHYGSEASIPPRVSPSGISKYKEDPGVVLDCQQIHKIQEQFVDAAAYAKQAGIDAVTFHACHGYLIAEFLSPAFNHRTDEYGGSFENRCRFLVEIIEMTKQRLGAKFPLLVRFSAEEFIKDGRSMEESVRLAKLLEEHGVSAIDISASQPSAYLMTTPPYCLPQGRGLLVPYSEAIKKEVKVPVFTAIGIREPQEAEQILQEGKADMICLGRPQIADPDYANKARDGKEKEIRHCLSCEFCLDTLDDDRHICCAVNPEAGREFEFSAVEKSSGEKNVVIVGGGPSGMEAARLAAVKGHRVTLIEREKQLGGTLNAAKLPPNKEMIGRLVQWYEGQLNEWKVKLLLDTEADETLIHILAPDIVFLANGAGYIRRIPGSESPEVIDVKTALLNPDRIGKEVVIIGGGASGAEAADYFAGGTLDFVCRGTEGPGQTVNFYTNRIENLKERHITIVEMLDTICSDMDVFCKDTVLYTLKQKNVSMMPSRRVERIEKDQVVLYNLLEGKEETVKADTVILAGGLKSNEFPGYEELPCETVRIGDASQPGKIKDAIYQAYVQVNNYL